MFCSAFTFVRKWIIIWICCMGLMALIICCILIESVLKCELKLEIGNYYLLSVALLLLWSHCLCHKKRKRKCRDRWPRSWKDTEKWGDEYEKGGNERLLGWGKSEAEKLECFINWTMGGKWSGSWFQGKGAVEMNERELWLKGGREVGKAIGEKKNKGGESVYKTQL